MKLVDIDSVLNSRVYSCRTGKFPYKRAYNNLIYDLEHAPSIEIVKCENCKYSFESTRQGYYYCEKFVHDEFDKDFFCKEGKRKE